MKKTRDLVQLSIRVGKRPAHDTLKDRLESVERGTGAIIRTHFRDFDPKNTAEAFLAYLSGLASSRPWPARRPAPPRVREAARVLLQVRFVRRALRDGNTLLAVGHAFELGVRAEGLHVAKRMRLAADNSDRGRKRVAHRWAKDATTRDDQRASWRKWNADLVAKPEWKSERKRCREIEKRAKKHEHIRASFSTIRAVIRESG